MVKTAQNFIASDSEICGGKPCIDGTRIRVWDVHVWHDLEGKSPAEIVAEFPQLTLASVYAALSYYHDHRDEVESQIKLATENAKRMDVEHGPTRFKKLRDALIHDDSLPS